MRSLGSIRGEARLYHLDRCTALRGMFGFLRRNVEVSANASTMAVKMLSKKTRWKRRRFEQDLRQGGKGGH